VELFAEVWREFQTLPAGDREHPAEASRRFDGVLVRRLCERFGVAPPDEARCHEVGRRKDVYVAERMDASFPGAAEAIRALAGRHELHTASGNPPYRIDALLRGMGVRGAFGLTVGPELPGVAKYRPGFYEAVFALAKVPPEAALVVDDDPGALADAAAAGAATVYVPRPDAAAVRAGAFTGVIASIAELPGQLERMRR